MGGDAQCRIHTFEPPVVRPLRSGGVVLRGNGAICYPVLPPPAIRFPSGPPLLPQTPAIVRTFGENVPQVSLFEAGGDDTSYFVKCLYHFLWRVGGFQSVGGSGRECDGPMCCLSKTKFVFVFWLHYKKRRGLVLRCLWSILLDGVYWVQVVMECLVIAFLYRVSSSICYNGIKYDKADAWY